MHALSRLQQLHRDPYRAEMGPALLARVPAELDALNEKIVVTVCSRLGFTIEHTRGRRTFAIELGNEALVDSLPGVPGPRRDLVVRIGRGARAAHMRSPGPEMHANQA